MEFVLRALSFLMMGGHIFFLSFVSAYFLLINPHIFKQQNTASRSLNKMVGLILLYQLMTYLLWLVPELVGAPKEMYDVVKGWEAYEEVLDYLDVLALPVNMLLGFVVTRGMMPPVKVFIVEVLITVVAIVIDSFIEGDWFFYIMSSVSLLFCVAQFSWYGYCVKTYHKKLMDQCSNIDDRTMSWYLHSQVPALIVAFLYVPLVAIHDESIYYVIYDVLLMAAHVYIVVAVMLHKVDDNMYSVMKEIDYRAEAKAASEKSAAPVEPQPVAFATQPAAAAAQPVAAAAQPVTVEPAAPVEPQPVAADPQPVVEEPQPVAADSQPVAAEPQPESLSPAPMQPEAEEPQEWTRTERESFDFSEQMQKLVDDEFYTDPDVNVDWLADHLGTNRHYVSNYLNQIQKQNFYEYVNNLRLEHAERLLRTSNEKASAIGYMSGFNSEGTYRRLFKERYGCTPTQYIKRAA